MAVLGNIWIIKLIVTFVPLWFPGIIMHVLAGEMSGIIIGNSSYVPDGVSDKPTVDDDRDLIVRVRDHIEPETKTDIKLNNNGDNGNYTDAIIYDMPNETLPNFTNIVSESIGPIDKMPNISLSKTTLPDVDLQRFDTQTLQTNTDTHLIISEYSEQQKNTPAHNDTQKVLHIDTSASTNSVSTTPDRVSTTANRVSTTTNRLSTTTDRLSTTPDSVSNESVKLTTQDTSNITNGYLNTTFGKSNGVELKENDTKAEITHIIQKPLHGTPNVVHLDQHRTPKLPITHHQMPFRHHHLQLVPMEDEPFGAVILKDQRYVVSVMIPIGVGIVGAAIIIVTLYTLRYIARKNAREFHFPDLERPRPHTSCISSISSERTDQVVLLGGDEDDEF